MSQIFVVDENIPPGLRYTEETSREVRTLPMRDCYLWQAGMDEPVCGLNVSPFRQRFGAAAVPCEGIGGVETLPSFRRRGLMTILMNKVIEGISQRATVALISDGIQGTYEKFGFVNCLAESYLSLQVRDAETQAQQVPNAPTQRVRGYSPDDLPTMVQLYNEAHQLRSWTHERPARWNRLHPKETWQAGSAAIVLEQESQVAGYAIFQEHQFGHAEHTYIIDELTAKDTQAAQALLREIAQRCWEMRIGEFWVREPLDSAAGRAAQRLGCVQHQSFPSSGGMMGKILDRQGLLKLLKTELSRRLANYASEDGSSTAFEALFDGKIIPDNGVLLRLLTGCWSLSEAQESGTSVPDKYEQALSAWFPGGGSRYLPQPYSHILDRY
jgi:GNAT superfamily N-acetyltransferase